MDGGVYYRSDPKSDKLDHAPVSDAAATIDQRPCSIQLLNLRGRQLPNECQPK